MYETFSAKETSQEVRATSTLTDASFLGEEKSFQVVDSVGFFDIEMYMSGMHGGHGGGKTSSFKRWGFLKDVGATNIANVLVPTIESRPSPFCYLHLLHGGGAVIDVPSDAHALGCREGTMPVSSLESAP